MSACGKEQITVFTKDVFMYFKDIRSSVRSSVASTLCKMMNTNSEGGATLEI